MTVWDFVDKLIRHPPAWFLVLLVMYGVVPGLRIILNWTQLAAARGVLVTTLEVIGAVVLAYLAIHLYYTTFLEGKPILHWYDHPFSMVFLFVFFIFGSLVIYLISRKLPE